jgi:hypothetical protein
MAVSQKSVETLDVLNRMLEFEYMKGEREKDRAFQMAEGEVNRMFHKQQTEESRKFEEKQYRVNEAAQQRARVEQYRQELLKVKKDREQRIGVFNRLDDMKKDPTVASTPGAQKVVGATIATTDTQLIEISEKLANEEKKFEKSLIDMSPEELNEYRAYNQKLMEGMETEWSKETGQLVDFATGRSLAAQLYERVRAKSAQKRTEPLVWSLANVDPSELDAAVEILKNEKILQGPFDENAVKAGLAAGFAEDRSALAPILNTQYSTNMSMMQQGMEQFRKTTIANLNNSLQSLKTLGESMKEISGLGFEPDVYNKFNATLDQWTTNFDVNSNNLATNIARFLDEKVNSFGGEADPRLAEQIKEWKKLANLGEKNLQGAQLAMEKAKHIADMIIADPERLQYVDWKGWGTSNSRMAIKYLTDTAKVYNELQMAQYQLNPDPAMQAEARERSLNIIREQALWEKDKLKTRKNLDDANKLARDKRAQWDQMVRDAEKLAPVQTQYVLPHIRAGWGGQIDAATLYVLQTEAESNAKSKKE